MIERSEWINHSPLQALLENQMGRPTAEEPRRCHRGFLRLGTKLKPNPGLWGQKEGCRPCRAHTDGPTAMKSTYQRIGRYGIATEHRKVKQNRPREQKLLKASVRFVRPTQATSQSRARFPDQWKAHASRRPGAGEVERILGSWYGF